MTSNTFFSEISDLSCLLSDMLQSENLSIKSLGSIMKVKFDKYWGDPEKMNFLIFYANILDSRDKAEFLPEQFKQLYGDMIAKQLLEKVKLGMKELFDNYVSTIAGPSSQAPATNVQPMQIQSSSIGRTQSRLKSQLKRQRLESGQQGSKKSELDIYLSETLVEESEDFDILRWWRINTERFPVLSKLARDVLAVPISTVASESCFSASGRILDPFRSSLTPKIVEALICSQDWLRLRGQSVLVEENIDDIERLEKELANISLSSVVGSSLPPVTVISFFIILL